MTTALPTFSELLDQPRPVRSGEELDAARLGPFLKATIPGLEGSLSIQQFPKGFSNLTYLLTVGGREMVLRRPPFGAKIKTAHDMGREFRILSHLHTHYTKVPRPLVYCQEESVLGAPFYVMERVKGVILRAAPPAGLELTPPFLGRLSRDFIDNLVNIHHVDFVAAGLGDLGKPDGYVTRQIEGWTKRYQNAHTDDLPEMDRVAAWLATHKPAESGACLIHNDYKYDNLVLDPDALTPGLVSDSDAGSPGAGSLIKAVFDWEMATIGDPLMDLGSTLGYWVDGDDPEEWRQHSFGVTTLPGNFNRQQLLDRYCQVSGRTISDPVFYYVYGLFKIAVIVQQIYARFKQGLTKDERFGRLIRTVDAASRTASAAINKGRISLLS